jgi:DNA-binding XRE family transcriptional regulator
MIAVRFVAIHQILSTFWRCRQALPREFGVPIWLKYYAGCGTTQPCVARRAQRQSHLQVAHFAFFHRFSWAFLDTDAIVTLVTTIVNSVCVYEYAVAKNSLPEAIASNVVRLLREEREKRGLSMNVVAQRSGLSHSIISLIERDLRNPTLDTLLRITEAIEVDLGAIIMRARKELAKTAK